MNTNVNTTADPNLPLIESAQKLIAAGQLTEAAAALNQARRQIPNDPRVYLIEGVMCERAGNVAGAFKLMQQGLALAPQWAPGIVVLARLQARQGHFEEANENANTALQLDSESRGVLDGAIDVAHLTGQTELAVLRLRQGLARYPSDTKWRRMLATDMSQLDRHDEALTLWDALIAESPQDVRALEGRMRTLLAARRLQEAAAVTTTLLALDPGNAVYAWYDALTRGQTPAHQPIELNRQIFDSAAQVFDQQLVQGLGYKLPQQIAQQIIALYPDKKLHLLDLGCGTGLLGAHLGKIQGRMVGVDISPKMLEQARRRNLYDSLGTSDLHDTLRESAASPYDVITALEVFLYVGDLGEAIMAAWHALVPGGRLIFSCESGTEDGPDLHLDPATERYVHKQSHVENQCRATGFAVDVETTTLRYQKGKPVQGFVVTARKAA